MVNVCIPVLRRYDLLKKLLLSLERSTLTPECIYVIDNGQNTERLDYVLREVAFKRAVVHTPTTPMGVAESWNWFLLNVPEERVITNDDIEFGPDSLQKMCDTKGDFVTALGEEHNAFSCFLLRDSCVKIVGMFDESLSPGYAYFEDCDYGERMLKLDVELTGVSCGVKHMGSQTLRAATSAEMQAHHRKFVLAQENYIKKWGRLPTGMHRQTL